MEEFDTELFITEIENRAAIWNPRVTEYSNKNDKKNAWDEVCELCVPNFQENTTFEKNEIVRNLQRKWKSLRDSFSREINAQKKEFKSGKGKSHRKKYVYCEQLSFLRSAISNKSTTSNLEEVEDVDEEESQQDLTQELDDTIDTSENLPSTSRAEPIIQHVPNKRKKKETAEEKLLEIMAKRLAQDDDKLNSNEDDEDRLFLLSLVKEIKKIPEDMRLDVKTEILQVIRKWQKNPVNIFFQQHNNYVQPNQNQHFPYSQPSPSSGSSHESSSAYSGTSFLQL